MTHDILQSDIDLARKLLDEHRSASQIVEALSRRGVELNRATQLVADLEAGKKVEPDKPIKINLPSSPIPRETGTVGPNSGRRTDSQGRRGDHSPSIAKVGGFPWFTTIVLLSAAVCIAAFVLMNHRLKSAERDHSADNSAAASDQTEQRRRLGSEPKAISLEVEKSGLSLCGNSITSENFLAMIIEILGSPTRTNRIENGDQTVYAYDASGLLVYSPKDSGHRSIVLDFEGTDGAAGTKNPFVGRLKVGGQLVESSTGAASLGLIKGLESQTPNSASGIFRARFGNFELVFGYLKTPERLSLVEIDF